MPLQSIDPNTLKSWLERKEAVLVDVREPAEFASARIEKSTLVPLGKICMAALPPTNGKKLVLHCRKGGRGGSACEKLLAENPQLELYNLGGGIEAWEAAGLAVTRGERNVLPLDRQVQLTVGLGVLAGSLLGYAVNPAFFLLSGFFGAGLTFAGLTGFCGLARLLAHAPWNQRA